MPASRTFVLFAALVVTRPLFGFQVEAAEFAAVVKKVDADHRMLVVVAGKQERTIRVPEDAKIIDAQGHVGAADGLKTKEREERFDHARSRTRMASLLREIRLGAKQEPAAESGPPAKQDTSQLVPLIDLGTQKYQGFQGGLYPEGKNARPPSHEAAGVKLAAEVQPLDANGASRAAMAASCSSASSSSNTVQAFGGFSPEVTDRDRDA